jgi:hypothetical protein
MSIALRGMQRARHITIAAVVLGSSVAWSSPIKVFPLKATHLPNKLRTAPRKMTNALARTLGADIAEMTIETAAKSSDCNIEDNACLEAIEVSQDVKRIVFGTVTERSDDQPGVEVRLTWYDADGSRQRKFLLDGDTTAELTDGLMQRVSKLPEDDRMVATRDTTPTKATAHKGVVFLAPDPVPPRHTRVAEIAPTAELFDAPAPAPTDTDKHDGVTTGTRFLAAAGGVGVLVGVGFVASGYSMKGQIDVAPAKTGADFQKMQAMESTERTRIITGDVLLVGGLGLAAYGAYRWYEQSSSRSEKPLRPQGLHVQPEIGGASMTFTKEWR